MHDEQIGDEPSMAAVAIRKRVDLREAVMEADRDLVGRISLCLDPCLGIIDEHAELGGNLPMVEADVDLMRSEPPGPPPHVTEHVPAQASDVAFRQPVAPPPQCPFLAACDVLLLGRVQLFAVGDVSQLESAPLLFAQRRRGVVRLLENVAHRSSHSERGFISSAKASIRLSKLSRGTCCRSSAIECSTAPNRRRATLRA